MSKSIRLIYRLARAKLLLTRIYNLIQTINLQLYSTNQLTLEHIYVTFEGKANLEKNNLQTVQAKSEPESYIELIALHPKNSYHLRSHLRAIMALDHSRLALENRSGRIFLRSTSL